MPCKEYYRISIFLAFSYGQANFIRIRDVPRVFLENEEKKIPVFNNIRLHVDQDMCTHMSNS